MVNGCSTVLKMAPEVLTHSQIYWLLSTPSKRERERKHRWGPTSPTAGLRARFDGGLRGPVEIIDKSQKKHVLFEKML
jgi:hypothetical protein